MKRDLVRIAERESDVLVIGGGIYGAFVAWDAALRGLSVALVEQGDFGHATSSNSLRVIHGGLRYLRQGDLRRMRESIRERTVLMRMAPHLVHPLPFMIPTYGRATRSKAALWLALKTHDLMGFDRNRLDDSQQHLPGSWTISRDQCLDSFPGIDERGLTGAGIYYDCQLASPERLVMDVIRSAVEAGAAVANYVEVTGFLTEGSRVCGVEARDVLTQDELEVRAKVVVNCTGPWSELVAGMLNPERPPGRHVLAKAFNLLVDRPPATGHALGVYFRDDPRAGERAPRRASSMFFVVPWHGMSLLGTRLLPYGADPRRVEVSEEEIEAFLTEVDRAYQTGHVEQEDVVRVYAGLLPADGFDGPEALLTRRHRIRDHQREDGLDGLLSVVGVKFTEARYVAEEAVDLVGRKLGTSLRRSVTAAMAVYGGQVGRFDEFLTREAQGRPGGLSEATVRSLATHYGSAYRRVLEHMTVEEADEDARVFDAEVRYAVREEMAQTVSDVLYRRTAKGTGRPPRDADVQACATIMATELGWTEPRAMREVKEAVEVRAQHRQVGAPVGSETA